MLEGGTVMSDRTRKYLPILKRIQKLGEKAKKQFIKKCDKEFIDCVSECAKNVITRSHGSVRVL